MVCMKILLMFIFYTFNIISCTLKLISIYNEDTFRALQCCYNYKGS